MNKIVLRSTLILPLNNPRFIEKVYLRGADAIMLDLEDSVPGVEKENARKLVVLSIPKVAQGGARVLVRVNNDPSLLPLDLDASIHPGLDGIALPKTETAEDVRNLEVQVENLERARGVRPGHIKFSILIETPRGLLKAREIAAASTRIESMSLGPEDYCLELGVEPSTDGMEIFYAVSKVVTVCKAFRIIPIGIMGSVGGFRDLEGFEKAANRARQIGCEGGFCIHPDQVEVLNRIFSPSQQKVEYARRVIEAFEEGLKRGTASVSLDGKMVDIPIYNRARLILDRAEVIAEADRKKAERLVHSNLKD